MYFLTAMVADHTKNSPSVTSADIAQSTREALVPRAQSIVDATTSSKRGWLKHDKETTRKRCRPIVRLAARPKPEARPQSGGKAEPAAKRRPGALRSALLATAATADNKLPKEVPLMHAQRNFSRRVVKFAPEGNLQGFQILYIQVLINMEPCTLLGEFLLGEREEYAFSGPQVRACREQQPGALSSKWVLQPLLTTGLEKEAAFQSGIQMASASWLLFDEVAFTENMVSSATWLVEEKCGSPPTLPCRHQRRSGHRHHVFDQVAGQHAANDSITCHSVVSTIEATGVLEEFQEVKPLMTREELLSSNHIRNLMKPFGRPRWTARRCSVPELPGKASEGVVHADATEAGRQCDPPRVGPTPAFGKQASGN